MSVLYVLVPIALVLASVFVALFLWAVRRGQFDDLNTPGVRILTDDDTAPPSEQRSQP
jgi:cbb3-type cytochrome oxidase maturation protein